MRKYKNILQHLIFVVIVSLVTALVYVTPCFIDNPINNAITLLTIVTYWLVVFVANTFIIGFMSSHKYVYAVLFPIYVLIGSIQAYFRLYSGATITPMIIDVAFHNDFQTSMELITIQMCLFVICNMLLSLLTIWVRIKYIDSHIHMLWLCPILLIGYLNINSRIYSGCAERYPINVFHSMQLYLKSKKTIEERVSIDKIQSATPSDSLDVILVLGESLRSDHMALNGYYRETTPGLQRLSNIISLPNVYTNYTYTNASLPHILTRADSTDEDIAYRERSLIYIFNQAGFHTTWIGNQDAGETYIDFMNEATELLYVHPEKSVFVYDEWYDKDIVPLFSQTIKEPNKENRLIVIHTIGNHWFYNIHVPDDCIKYRPIVRNREIKQNTPEEVINSYDNCVVATDQFLCSLIDNLKERKSILIFLSDHGECLGENDEWLHANENQAISNTACLVWYSDKYYDEYRERIDTLRERCRNTYYTDFLYHSILSAAGIRTQLYKSDMDIFD